MKQTISPFVMTIWMPALLSIGCSLFLYGTAPIYWLLFLPMWLVIAFMSTLAAVRDDGQSIHIRRWWKSTVVLKQDIARIGPAFLDGVGVVYLRRFAFPWG